MNYTFDIRRDWSPMKPPLNLVAMDQEETGERRRERGKRRRWAPPAACWLCPCT